MICRDHFCPWVVNTVGFYNRKFFVLFLGYTFLSTAWVLLTSLPFLYETYQRPGGFRVLERQWGALGTPLLPWERLSMRRFL